MDNDYFAVGDVMTFSVGFNEDDWMMTGFAVWMMTGFALEGFNVDRLCGLAVWMVTGFALVGLAVWMMTGFALVGFEDDGLEVVGFDDVGLAEVGFGDGLRVNKTGVVSFSITPVSVRKI